MIWYAQHVFMEDIDPQMPAIRLEGNSHLGVFDVLTVNHDFGTEILNLYHVSLWNACCTLPFSQCGPEVVYETKTCHRKIYHVSSL